jgi:glutamate-1-semialdehyde 2,1-aminomutase
VYAAPYPPYIAEGSGLLVRDVDGNPYRDFLGNYTSLILGHAHPAVVAAVERQARRGSAFAAPTETEVELAEELTARIPSLERVRFTTSGTEATMFAIRAARAFTRRPLVGRFDGAYHGTHDTAMAGTPGVPPETSGLVVDLPWNDLEGVEATLRATSHDIAAVIVEPVQGAGGVREASPTFLAGLRDLTERIGAILIFDEVISFRLGRGGGQGLAGVTPDLTTLGKIIGGGYPLAAFGGRADLMDQFDARRAGALSHGGTYNGNPVAAAAGLATLHLLDDDAFGRLDALGARLRAAVPEIHGVGSLFQIHAPGATGHATATGAADPAATFLGLLLEGFYVAPRGMGAIPLVATETDVDDLAAAVSRVLAEQESGSLARV